MEQPCIACCDPWQPGRQIGRVPIVYGGNMRILYFVFPLFLLAGFVFAQEPDSNLPESPNYQVTVTADRLEEPVTDKTD